MADALYGDNGFYTASGAPARNFRTAAHTGPAWADAIAALANRVDRALGLPDDFTVVDIGAGGGELLSRLAMVAPERWSLLGVDVAGRPGDLPDRVSWQRQFPSGIRGVLVAVELLDVVPVDVVELGPDTAQLVEVSPDGTERLGADATTSDRDWLARWWPVRRRGERGEVGTMRDQMWQEITAGLDAGLALAVDYAARPGEHIAGTLAGYRDGRLRAPVPDATMDLTAHVLFESLTRDGDLLLTQREALRRLGLVTSAPAYSADPGRYLADLARTSAAAELLDADGLGGFMWLMRHVGVPQLLAG